MIAKMVDMAISPTRSSEFRVQAKMLSYAELNGGFNGEVQKIPSPPENSLEGKN